MAKRRTGRLVRVAAMVAMVALACGKSELDPGGGGMGGIEAGVAGRAGGGGVPGGRVVAVWRGARVAAPPPGLAEAVAWRALRGRATSRRRDRGGPTGPPVRRLPSVKAGFASTALAAAARARIPVAAAACRGPWASASRLPPGARRKIAAGCVAESPATCGLDGKCDGAGACRRHIPGTPCGGGACMDAAVVGSRACDGAGSCKPNATIHLRPVHLRYRGGRLLLHVHQRRTVRRPALHERQLLASARPGLPEQQRVRERVLRVRRLLQHRLRGPMHGVQPARARGDVLATARLPRGRRGFGLKPPRVRVANPAPPR